MTHHRARTVAPADGSSGKAHWSAYELARRFIRSKFEHIARREASAGRATYHWLTAIDARITQLTLVSVHDKIFMRQMVEGGVL